MNKFKKDSKKIGELIKQKDYPVQTYQDFENKYNMKIFSKTDEQESKKTKQKFESSDSEDEENGEVEDVNQSQTESIN